MDRCNWLSYLGSCAALWLMVLPSAASDASHLSSAQAAVVAAKIAKLKYAEERSLASRWTDAKKAAEFICRPLAMRVLKRHFRDADRVFLGTDEPGTLRLLSDRRLSGTGQVRVGYDWQTFTFSCVMDPRTAKALSFATTLTIGRPGAAGEEAPPSFQPLDTSGRIYYWLYAEVR
jgi:hypothetical protein